MSRKILPLLLLILGGCAPNTGLADNARVPVVPLVDFHQHLVSPAFQPLVRLPERDGAALVREMDAAGVGKAVVLSVGYSMADERKKLTDPDRLTREENDWTSAQVTANAPRLIGFCSANPLRDASLAELARCLGLPGMVGIKLHFGNSGVSLRNPDHLARIRAIAALAEQQRAPVLIHFRARGGANFGPEDARLLLEQVVPAAPHADFIVAHLGFAGPGYPPENDEIMRAFGDRLQAQKPEWRRVWFDVATNVTEDITPEEAAEIAARLRQVGIGRILYGSDLTPPGGSIRSGWDIFRTRLPLTPAEIARIARNRPAFAR